MINKNIQNEGTGVVEVILKGVPFPPQGCFVSVLKKFQRPVPFEGK